MVCFVSFFNKNIFLVGGGGNTRSSFVIRLQLWSPRFAHSNLEPPSQPPKDRLRTGLGRFNVSLLLVG